MNDCKITDKKRTCLILAILFWGVQLFIELFGKTVLVKLFPLELLLKYVDPVFYGTFFIALIIAFRKTFLCDIKDFVKNWEKYFKWTAIFVVITLFLMVASAIILDSLGIGDSSNQQAIDESIIQYGVLHIIVVCFIGPVVEEVFYRGIFFSTLKGREGSAIRCIVAVLVTALIFGAMHVSFTNFTMNDLLSNIPIMMLGMTVAILYWRTDNILCPILVHIVVNSIGTFA